MTIAPWPYANQILHALSLGRVVRHVIGEPQTFSMWGHIEDNGADAALASAILDFDPFNRVPSTTAETLELVEGHIQWQEDRFPESL